LGGNRRPLSRSLTVPGFNLRRQSQDFADELSSLLNNTVCHGIRLSSVISDGEQTRAVVGYRISKENLTGITGIPITCTGRHPKFYLGVSMRLAPDHQRKYLMVNSSVMILAIGKDVSNDANILLHNDYEREKADGYPEAHLQVHASSDAWNSLTRLDGERRSLDKLHLPVGGRRFRPTLEDLIVFLVTENLVHKHPQCDKTIAARRKAFHEKQLRAAVRQNPHPAIEQLREQGYVIKEPKNEK
jgi:hypothetical protein